MNLASCWARSGDSVVSSSRASGAWPRRPAALRRGPIVKPMSSQSSCVFLSRPVTCSSALVAGGFGFGNAGDSAVDGDDDVAALIGDCSEGLVVEAVAFVDAVGDVRLRLCAEKLEAKQKDRARGYAVGVVVTVDGDSSAGAD